MMGEKKKIISQMQQLWRFERLSPNVKHVNLNIYTDNRSVGIKSRKIRFGSYIDTIDSINENEEYSIEFFDGAMVNFWYEFDETDNCVMHSISYMPYYKDLTIIETEDANLDINYFCERVSQYLRIDYEELGRKEFCHSLIHMHMGPGRGSLRIPVDSVVYPDDFMFFVLNYIYGEEMETNHFQRRNENEVIRKYLTEAEGYGARLSFV